MGKKFSRRGRLVLLLVGSLGLIQAPVVNAQQADLAFTPDTLKKLSLEQLFNLEVTSVSRRSEKLSQVASAIQVITQEDIRRSGATSLPEALRLAGNLQIGQKNSHDWAINARGFNTELANKLLVLIDGRTVYTPLFSGVFWDRQDYLLEDIERIEVISGPGGTLWGANAVNGVINIITKKSGDTRGLYAEAGVGSQLRYSTAVRYGGEIGSNVSYRVYGKYFDRDDAVFPNGEDASDSWWMGQFGFRVDARASEKSSLTLQGDLYRADENIPAGTTDVRGKNILARWTYQFSDDSDLNVQVYFDNATLEVPVPESRNDENALIAPAGVLRDDTDTYDFDLQHSFRLGRPHQIVWGLGYRHIFDEVENAPALAFEPAELKRDLFSVFAQDKIALPANFALTLGAKIEHNDYTGFEFEPSARLQTSLTDNQMVWASVSRAVRMPSRADTHIRYPTPGFEPLLSNLLIGGPNFRSENVLAYEFGYRANFGSKISGSVSTFYNVYDDVRSTSLSPPDPLLGLPFPLFFDNNLEGETYGVELAATYQVLDWWRLHGTYNVFHADIRVKPGEFDLNNALNETADPENRFSVRSSINLLRNFELDAGLRWVDSFIYNNNGSPAKVDSYTELEARLGWRVSKNFELSIVGQNLLNNHHLEYALSDSDTRAEIERSIYGKIVCRF